MNKEHYLKRIDCNEVISATDKVLVTLHQKHVYAVPFENLDIHYNKLFDLEIDKVYHKVVNDRRGGFCYELNLLFNWLLNRLGFNSRIIASRIFNEEGVIGPAFDHMSVYVKTDKEYLVDVGYGDLFITPIAINGGAQWDGRNYFRIDQLNEAEYLLSMSADATTYSKRYTFSLDEVKVDDFNAMCFDKQTNPDSYFVKNLICTTPTPTGRLTIFNNKLIERQGARKIEMPIESDSSLRMYLRDKFDIVLAR